MMSAPVDVLIAVPARDEATLIGRCLTSVLAAVRVARAADVVHRATVAVGAHRCRDETAALADRLLSDAAEVASVVITDAEVAPVGAVRTKLVHRALAVTALDRTRSWLFSTDADSSVPADWMTTGLRLAHDSSAAMVVGLVDLAEPVDHGLLLAHDRLIKAGIRPDGTHTHVYAANLAIRLDVFAEVGGFPSVLCGEEHALLARVEAAGHRVLRTTSWRVATSSRTKGRAVGGLGDLLGRLAADEPWERTA
jgi:hypothetical protein